MAVGSPQKTSIPARTRARLAACAAVVSAVVLIWVGVFGSLVYHLILVLASPWWLRAGEVRNGSMAAVSSFSNRL